MSDTIRTFIALNLPDFVTQQAASIQQGLIKDGFRFKWVRAENIHLTLKFLGYVTQNTLPAIQEAMQTTAAMHGPLTLSAKGLGVFPNIRRPRVLWMGLKGQTAELIRMQNDLEETLDDAGFPKESRRFNAHLTIARIKDPIRNPKDLTDAMTAHGRKESDLFTVDEIMLIKSDLQPTGAVYTPLFRVALD